jgi:hypothetical protein
LQPAFIIVDMQSQHAWTISAHLASPLVQVTVQPFLVISHLLMHIIMLQQQTIMPFIIAQQLTMPPASMLQRFCIMLHAVGSSHVHVIFMPPEHFSNFMVQRGTIIMFGIIGAVPVPGAMPVPMPGMPIPVRSIIIALVISGTPFATRTSVENTSVTDEILCAIEGNIPVQLGKRHGRIRANLTE